MHKPSVTSDEGKDGGQGKLRKVEHVLSEYGVVDHTELLEELQKEIESDQCED